MLIAREAPNDLDQLLQTMLLYDCNTMDIKQTLRREYVYDCPVSDLEYILEIQQQFTNEDSSISGRWIMLKPISHIAHGRSEDFMDIYWGQPLGYDKYLRFHVVVYIRGVPLHVLQSKLPVQEEFTVVNQAKMYPSQDDFINELLKENACEEHFCSGENTVYTSSDQYPENISEEEKHTIDAFMLDGLNKPQAVSMFLNNRFMTVENKSKFYKLKDEYKNIFR